MVFISSAIIHIQVSFKKPNNEHPAASFRSAEVKKILVSNFHKTSVGDLFLFLMHAAHSTERFSFQAHGMHT